MELIWLISRFVSFYCCFIARLLFYWVSGSVTASEQLMYRCQGTGANIHVHGLAIIAGEAVRKVAHLNCDPLFFPGHTEPRGHF